MNAPTNAVVVAVGADGADAALTFAVTEARRTQLPVHLVHVLPLKPGEAYVGVYGGMLDTAKATLAEACRKAEELAGGDVAVTVELIASGWIVDDLVRCTNGASLLVLQHRALSKLRRVFTGSIAQSVAGRSHVPVVSVPQNWTPRVGDDAVVVAAVQDPVEAPALLRSAFEQSRARGLDLVVLHAWWLASGFDVVVVDTAYRDEFAARSHEELKPVLAPLLVEFPDVQVRVTVQHAPPIEAVLDAAERADLLVLGRRHHLLPSRSHLGPVARAAIDHSACPVFVTPELGVAAKAAPDSDLATAGR
jgi:nucleotide-binding universal stress UspA family protein